MILFGQSSGRPDPIDPRRLLGSRTLTTATLFDYARTPDELRELAEPLFAEAEAGGIRARIDRVLPLADAARAHELLEERKTTGKLLLAT